MLIPRSGEGNRNHQESRDKFPRFTRIPVKATDTGATRPGAAPLSAGGYGGRRGVRIPLLVGPWGSHPSTAAGRRSRPRRRRATCQPWRSHWPTERASGKLVGERDAGRGAEPDHRAAEARPRRRGSPSRSRPACRASAVSGMLSKTAETNPSPSAAVPGGGGQLLHRHHRGAGDQAEQEDRPLEGRRAAATSRAGGGAR